VEKGERKVGKGRERSEKKVEKGRGEGGKRGGEEREV